MVEGHEFPCVAPGVSSFAQEPLGRHLWVGGYLAVSSGKITDEMIQEYIEEQEGVQISNDRRFSIDSPWPPRLPDESSSVHRTRARQQVDRDLPWSPPIMNLNVGLVQHRARGRFLS